MLAFVAQRSPDLTAGCARRTYAPNMAYPPRTLSAFPTLQQLRITSAATARPSWSRRMAWQLARV